MDGTGPVIASQHSLRSGLVLASIPISGPAAIHPELPSCFRPKSDAH